MARMHARKRGKSGSRSPVRDEAPEWVTMLPREVEAKVVELAKGGKQPAEVGLVLRDSHGVPNVKEVTGKSITRILADNGLTGKLPQDLENLIHRAINLQEHVQTHRHDLHNRRGLDLIESRIRRLTDYYHRRGLLPAGWKYSRAEARLLVG